MNKKIIYYIFKLICYQQLTQTIITTDGYNLQVLCTYTELENDQKMVVVYINPSNALTSYYIRLTILKGAHYQHFKNMVIDCDQMGSKIMIVFFWNIGKDVYSK